MKPPLIAIAILTVLLTGAFTKASGEPSLMTQNELDVQELKARRFVCGSLTTIGGASGSECFEHPITVRIDGDTRGFLAYFHHDGGRISLSKKSDPIGIQLNLVHELTHAYRDQFNPHEETWLDEGLAKWMEYKYSTVWPVSYQDKLRRNPDLSLRNDEQDYLVSGDGYVSSFFFVLYLHNRFGGEHLIRKLAQSKLSGWDNIETALLELKREGRIGADESLLKKNSILRHFALALWLNDPFAAKYSLFSLDPRYESLAGGSIRSGDLASRSIHPEEGEARIVFSKRFQVANAAEVFALVSRSPLVIEKAQPGKPAEIFIYIFR